MCKQMGKWFFHPSYLQEPSLKVQFLCYDQCSLPFINVLACVRLLTARAVIFMELEWNMRSAGAPQDSTSSPRPVPTDNCTEPCTTLSYAPKHLVRDIPLPLTYLPGPTLMGECWIHNIICRCLKSEKCWWYSVEDYTLKWLFRSETGCKEVLNLSLGSDCANCFILWVRI